jgi:hypothetical protein
MGNTSYSVSNRVSRAFNSGYHTKSVNEIFTQNVEQKIHESMSPKGIVFREARDSKTHPNTVPIILSLDVTGSMGKIPHYLVKDGLPHMMGNIIQKGIPDPALLFLAVGDHAVDHYPLQVGQFESGDEELDLWLTRTYIEGGGGGNEGESYLLAWYFAAFHTATDAWQKRNQKGFLFTVGDEPSLKVLPKTEIQHLMGNTPQAGYTDQELLTAAQKHYHVYHLHIMQGNAGQRSAGYWKELLGENAIMIDNYEEVSNVIANIVTKHTPKSEVYENHPDVNQSDAKEEILL